MKKRLASTLAFPEAEGFGALTFGGRGGRVIEVTHLNDDGPGSFRAAVSESGPRIVVFRVAGTVRLTNQLAISEPYLTIAGQTAPGGGITIRSSHQIDFGGEGNVHDVIVRHVRFRYDITHGSENQDIVNVTGHNLIFDHCSFSWGTDETFSVSGKSYDVTIQWCLIGEPLYKAMHVSTGARNVTLHHNLFAHSIERAPKLRGYPEHLNGKPAIYDFRNNVIYNWRSYATGIAGSAHANVVNNYFRQGPDTPPPRTIAEIVRMQFACLRDAAGQCVPGSGRAIYVSGNYGPSCSTYDCNDQWNSIVSDVEGRRRKDTAVEGPHPAPPVETSSAQTAYEEVLTNVGATVPKRDAVDLRIVNHVRTGTGRIIKGDPTLADGWPQLEAGTSPADFDHDGMPDEWERAIGTLNPKIDDSARYDLDPVYTNVEVYLNRLASGLQTAKP